MRLTRDCGGVIGYLLHYPDSSGVFNIYRNFWPDDHVDCCCRCSSCHGHSILLSLVIYCEVISLVTNAAASVSAPVTHVAAAPLVSVAASSITSTDYCATSLAMTNYMTWAGSIFMTIVAALWNYWLQTVYAHMQMSKFNWYCLRPRELFNHDVHLFE